MDRLTKEQQNFLLSSIRDVYDFPKKGIVFKDITTLLNNSEAFSLVMDHLEAKYKKINLEYIIGIESRGFIFGSALATRLGIGFVPIRKKGKLPSLVVSQEYELEYGHDELEIHVDAFQNKIGAKVLLIDDLCATGGTAVAASKLILDTKSSLIEVCFLMNLTFLNGKEKVEKLAGVYSVLDI